MHCAEHIPEPLRETIFKWRTRAEERRSKNTAQTTLISEEDELDIALHVEEENTLEQALQVDIEASVEMSTRKMQDLPPPPTTQEEVRQSPFSNAFEHSQKVELNGLLAVGCCRRERFAKRSESCRFSMDAMHTNCLKTKSRVVAKEFTQVQDVDYHKTMSHTPTSAPVKMIAAIANEKSLPVFHLDVSQAFVQAPLEEEIFMRLPPGCGELSGKVVKLLKCQYGLKQAGREWHSLLVTWLVEKIGMEQCKAEPSVFRKIIKNEVSLMVGVHVDDIVVSGEHDLYDELCSQLKQRFPVKNLGELKMYTGCAFERGWDKGILEMDRTAFAKSMVQQYNISATSNILESPAVDLGPRKDGEPGANEEFPKYRALVGSLMWMSVITRPDIVNALRACARHSHNPSPRHWMALLQVAASVNATKEMGLRFVRGSGLRLSVYEDVNFAAASNDRRSVSGVAVMLGDTAIGLKSSTQKCVTTVLCEAEYAMRLRRRYSQERFWFSFSRS